MSGSSRMLAGRGASTLMPVGAPRLASALPGQVLTPLNAGLAAGAALAQRFVRDGTWQVPTLIRSRTMHLCDDPAFREDPGLRYVAPSALRTWRKAADKFARFPASSRETFRAVYATLLALTKVLDDVAVRMLAGSDSGGAAWELPGIALHQEFDELARAGLPPLRVLQMTTSDAAGLPGHRGRHGQRGPGQVRRPGPAQCQPDRVGRSPAPYLWRRAWRPLLPAGRAQRAQGESRSRAIGPVTGAAWPSVRGRHRRPAHPGPACPPTPCCYHIYRLG